MIVNKKVFLKEISKALLKLVLAGVIIGIFKKYDAILAILFLLRHFWKMFFQKKDSCAGCGISKAMKTKI